MRFARILLLTALTALVAVPLAFALAFTDDSFNFPTGLTGVPYSHNIDARGGCPPYDFRVISGQLPAGITMSSDGKFRGTPTTPGRSGFWVEIGDECNKVPGAPGGIPSRDFEINVVQNLSVQQNSLAPIYVNEPYSFQLTSAGGGTQNWSIASGTLPPGIALSAAGLLSGTPPTTGEWTFVVKVTDGFRLDTETLTLVVVQRVAGTATTPAGEVGVPYSGAVAATGGKQPYSFEVTSGALPAGLVLDPTSGAISGTPTAAGLTAAVVTVKDALGLTAPINANIAIAAKLAVQTKLLKPAKEGKRYLARLKTSGGIAPTTWKLVGTLPRGLRFNARTGIISGTPTRDGKFTLRFSVTDSLGAKATAKLKLVVTPTA